MITTYEGLGRDQISPREFIPPKAEARNQDNRISIFGLLTKRLLGVFFLG